MELKDIEQRLLTRFKWGLSAQLNTPDYDTKLKIIRVKAQKLGAQISDDVVAYLADNISANVREIEGALSSLVANASFLGRKITTSLAKEILKVYVQLYQKEITHRPHHRGRVRIPEPRFRTLQLHGAHARDRPGPADRHVPRQAAHQGTAHDHRVGHRRPQPRHGAPLVQGRDRT